jgi:hypothetical protein
MPTAKHGYFLKDGTRVPSVTGILSRFKESGGLIHWAYEQGKAGLDYRETKQKAADAGTVCHDMVECYANGVEFDPSKFDKVAVEKAKGAYDAFLAWASQTGLKIIKTEQALVSEKYKYGGTLDAMLVQDKLALGDWKCANGVYGDYVAQIAAYGQLWNENNPDNPIVGGYHLLRFSKQEHPDDPVSFTHHYWSDVSVALKLFLLLREAYALDQRVKKMV